MTRKLKDLNEFFIRTSRDSDISRLPIVVKNVDRPIVALEKWRELDGHYVKTYVFQSIQHRNAMIKCLLEYEENVKHCATISIEEGSVMISVSTKTVDTITELDREYARYADQVYKDVILYAREKKDQLEYDW